MPADDDQLQEWLRSVVVAGDPVPAEALAFASAALTWRTVDDELAGLLEVASLTGDSSLDDPRLAGVRSTTMAGPRLLTFDGSDLAVEVEVTPIGERRRVVGQVVPAQGASIEIRHKGKVASLRADELGRFSYDGVKAGPMSIRCRPDAVDAHGRRRVLDTSWITV